MATCGADGRAGTHVNAAGLDVKERMKSNSMKAQCPEQISGWDSWTAVHGTRG
jgi:hypothetical protein